MMYPRKRTLFAACIGFLILVLDSKTALEGAVSGIDLCLQTVIPSLFPFFVLSLLLTDGFMGLKNPILRPLGRLCGIPEGAESLLVIGFIGGYPVGAQCIYTAYASGSLPRQQAQRMLMFCNNAGPAFLFGMVSSVFSARSAVWLLWGIHILSAVLVSLTVPRLQVTEINVPTGAGKRFTDAVAVSLRVMAGVCGWIVLFRVLIAYLERWFLWMLPLPEQVLLSGLLELSNGCCALKEIESEGLRFIICSVMLGFGGLCVAMQTAGAARSLGCSHYLRGKLLQTTYSVILAYLLQLCFPVGMRWLMPWYLLCLAALFCLSILLKTKNKSRFLPAVGV